MASLASGSRPAVTWSISGIAGATINNAGIITIPAGLSAGTYSGVVTARNSLGSDTESFDLVVNARILTRPTIGTIASGVRNNNIITIYFSTPINDGGTGSLTSLEYSVDGSAPRVRIRNIGSNNAIYRTGQLNYFLDFSSEGLSDAHQLVNRGRHTVRVRISNSVGTSDWSNTLTINVP